MTKRKVVFDTDPGVDDAFAFLLLLADPGIDLVGVTSVWGNAAVDVTTRNVLYLKERFGYAGPVARGAAGPINGAAIVTDPDIHGANGLGDIDLPAVTAEPDPRPAHRFLIDTVRETPGEVTILAVGPLTNLALALTEAPEIAGLVRDLVIMGGAFGFNGHLGNVSPAAEANVWNDPEAADAVFAADWPVTVIGLDATMETIMPNAYLADLRAAAGRAGAFLWDISRGYAGFYNKVLGVDGIFAHDSLAAAVLTTPDLVSTRSGAIRTVLEGFARGQTIQRPDSRTFAPGDPWEGRRSHRIATGVDAARFLSLFAGRMERLAGG